MTDPLVPRGDALPAGSRDLLESIAGTAANAALILAVVGVVLGAVMAGIGTVSSRPQMSQSGWFAVVGAACSAVVAAGLSLFVAWLGDRAFTLWIS